ncbi:MAG: hypothetical protein ABJZ55_13050 [Fuerstiella sp.]
MLVGESKRAGGDWIRRSLIAIVLLDVIVLSFYWLYTPSLFEELEGHRTGANCSAISNDGMFLATGTDAGVIRIWDSDGEFLKNITGHSGRISCICFSTSMGRLATGGGKGEIRVWSVPAGIETVMMQENNEAVLDLAFSDDGQWLYSVGQSASLCIWDVFGGKLVTKVPLPAIGTTCALHPKEPKLLVGCEDGIVRMCDVSSKQVTDVLVGHSGSITGLAVTADWMKVATSAEDRTVRLWDLNRRSQLASSRSRAIPEDVVFCDGDRHLLSGTQQGHLHVISVQDGKRVCHVATPLRRVQDLSNKLDVCVAAGNKAKAILFSFEDLMTQ